jgi:hypothetical protein
LAFAARSFLRDGVLWYVPHRRNKESAALFTPFSLQKEVISGAHGKPLTGHWGVERTVFRIEGNYFWPTLTQDVTEYIRRCKQCQHAARPPPPATLTPWLQAQQPNDRVHVDLFGPLQGDPNYKYVAVMTCAFTKWAEVVPIENKEATTVAKVIFEQWICRRGVMKLLVSDGGKEFANQVLEELCKLMKCDKHVVSPYHPMANGQVERFNRDMRKYLITIMQDTTEWVSFLKPLQFAHNSSLNKSTNFTPHYLTFLQHPRLPDSLDSTKINYSSSYSADAFKKMQFAHRLVYDNNEQARAAYTANYNKKVRTRDFTIGDEVLVIFPVAANILNKKLSPVWKGPFQVTNILNNNVLEIKASPRAKTQRVHVNRVRLFNHLEDTILSPEEPKEEDVKREENEPKKLKFDETIQIREFDDDDDDDDVDYYEDIDDADQVDPQPGPALPGPATPPPAQAPPPLGLLDRVALDLFPGRTTRSGGPVADVPLPNRPAEYRPYVRRLHRPR